MIGGLGGSPQDVWYASLYENGEVSPWTSTTLLPDTMASLTSVVYNGHLYVISGWKPYDATYKDIWYAPINSDGTIGNWNKTTSLLKGRASHTSVSFNGYAYAIGGYNYGADMYYNEVEYAPFGPPSPPTCVIELRKKGAKIDEIDVGDSADDIGIKEVRFSSDESQDGNPTGGWTEWYGWDTSSGDWNAETKIKTWSFATGGDKEVWAEIKDGSGDFSQCNAPIYAHPGYAIIVAGHGRWWAWGEDRVFDHCANNAYRVLRNSGFDDDHIFYLNNESQQIDEQNVVDNYASYSYI